MKRSFKAIAVGFTSAALVALSLVVVPTAARAADPVCATAGGIKSCQGVTSDGAAYALQAPLNFNGTAFLYSKGYRYPISIPGLWDVAAAKLPEQVPGGAAQKTSVATYLLSKGYGVFSSGFAKAGWNADGAVKTNVELIGIWKKEFPNTKKIVAWGESQGGFITQALAENHPDLVDAAVPMCMVGGSVEAALKMAGDALWGMKVFFDPTIKAGGYSAGAAGVVEQLTDISKIAAALTSLSQGVATGAWPATATGVPAALKTAIPSRSAVTLVGQMAGLPNISANIDGVSGPGDPASLDHARFVLGAAPAIATLQNLQDAAILGVLITADLEAINGGRVYDNSKADYDAQLGDAKTIFNLALSGDDAADALLGVLNAAPRVTADAAALTKLRAMLSHKGVVNVPTIAMTAPFESTTPGGHVQWLINANAANIAKAKEAAVAAIRAGKPRPSTTNKLMTIWNFPPEKYTTFTATGLPDTTKPAANGTKHCNYTVAQLTSMAEIGALAANAGKLPNTAQVRLLMRKAGGLSFDRTFEAPLLKFYAVE
ncbi:MAG: alpha/beta hydrolase family protein [Candidatus Nanopelagicaceae bacterium]